LCGLEQLTSCFQSGRKHLQTLSIFTSVFQLKIRELFSNNKEIYAGEKHASAIVPKLCSIWQSGSGFALY